jgi:hypothetical protein
METADGKQTRSPSGFSSAESLFDTEHLHSRDKAPAYDAMVGSHIFIDSSGLSSASMRGGRRQASRDDLENPQKQVGCRR